MSRVVGLDPSLTGFGVAAIEGGRLVGAARLNTGGAAGHERIERLIEHVSDWCCGACLVVIEGPSYGSATRAQQGHHERAGLWWAIAQDLWRDGLPYAVVSPGTRAKYATGNGRAGKADVVAAVSAWGIGPVTDDNIADAFVLAAMGARHLGQPLPGDGGREDLLAAVTWPAEAGA